jgi:hypothetical protein
MGKRETLDIIDSYEAIIVTTLLSITLSPHSLTLPPGQFSRWRCRCRGAQGGWSDIGIMASGRIDRQTLGVRLAERLSPAERFLLERRPLLERVLLERVLLERPLSERALRRVERLVRMRGMSGRVGRVRGGIVSERGGTASGSVEA